MNDTHYVATSEVIEAVKEWSATAFPYWSWDKPHQYNTILINKMNGVTLYSPIKYIAEQIGVSHRNITNFMSCRSEYTTFRKAEKILMAIEKEYLLGSTIKVYTTKSNTNT